jgi:hypothetical protein
MKSGRNKFRNLTVIRDARGRVVGCGSMLEAGRASVRVLDEVEFLICLIFPAALWPQWSTQLVPEVSTRNLPGGKKRPRVWLTSLPPPVGRLSDNVGASNPRNPKGLHVVYRDNFTFTLLSVIHCHYEIREE